MKQRNFNITGQAFNQIAKLTAVGSQGVKTRLRVTVLGGGCSGFQYQYKFDSIQEETDLIFGTPEAEVIIDDISLGLLENSVLDYSEDLGRAGFEIRNPNAKARCGCGNSFST